MCNHSILCEAWRRPINVEVTAEDRVSMAGQQGLDGGKLKGPDVCVVLGF